MVRSMGIKEEKIFIILKMVNYWNYDIEQLQIEQNLKGYVHDKEDEINMWNYRDNFNDYYGRDYNFHSLC